MLLVLSFSPAVSYEGTSAEIVNLTELSDHMQRVLQLIVYPRTPLKIEYNRSSNTIDMELYVMSEDEAELLIQDAVIGVRYIDGVGVVEGIATDTWLEGDIDLTEDDLNYITSSVLDDQVYFTPVLQHVELFYD